jgi:hypothetical protein
MSLSRCAVVHSTSTKLQKIQVRKLLAKLKEMQVRKLLAKLRSQDDGRHRQTKLLFKEMAIINQQQQQ